MISQFLTFINLITSTIHVGTPFSLSSILPSLFNSKDSNEYLKIYSYFKFFSIVFLILTILVTIIIFLFSENISYLLVDSVNENKILKIIALSIPFTVVYAIFESFLRSSNQINKMVKVTVLTAVITVPALFILILFFKIEGIAFYILIGSIIPFMMMLFYCKKIFSKDVREKSENLTAHDIKNVFKAGITSLFAFLFNQLVILYLRKFIISNFSNEDNGIYQAVLGLSMNLFAFIYSFLGNHTLTQMSVNKVEGKDDQKLISIINETARFILIILVPILVLMYSYKNLIIILLYSEKFFNANNLLIFQFIGDSFRIFASLFSLWLFSRMKIKILIIVDLIFNISLFLLPNLFLLYTQNDLRIVPVAYMIASFIQFILFFIYTKISLNFKFNFVTRKYIFLSIFILVLNFLISNFLQEYSMYLSWILLSVWGFVLINYIEKMSLKKLFISVRKKFNK